MVEEGMGAIVEEAMGSMVEEAVGAMVEEARVGNKAVKKEILVVFLEEAAKEIIMVALVVRYMSMVLMEIQVGRSCFLSNIPNFFMF